ncbi:MAG: FeS-binding protein [SAR202 cluster bacterium MP-SInd-SRR3963457-G2]|jgi:ABC-type methionine transport system ATPase subunit|nr:MAG: FeS-binding protein [SAR202 cluster bacterium]PKB78114.1 MAG: FeS-binding protein [SAR202 cluster bacterium MP-SInd-SRR3963457-G2]HIM81260.1 FeS-binding protein [Dehalococcoidia bacterium]|tara:strand:+ start:278 stop:520 length:243 start_codon:yes stop_codon:yes gene_type:complete
MGTQRVKFTFMTQMVKEPIIYQLGQNFNLVTNIRRADVREDMGWVVLELDGDDTEIQRGLDWVSAIGVRVDPLSGDVIEG